MIETKFKLRPLRNLHPSPPPSVTTLAPNGNNHSRYDRYRQLTITSSCVTEGGYAPSAVTAARRLKGRHRWTEACNGNGYTGATKRAREGELPKAASGGNLPKRARGLPNPSSDVTVLTEQPTSTGHCLLRDFALLRQASAPSSLPSLGGYTHLPSHLPLALPLSLLSPSLTALATCRLLTCQNRHPSPSTASLSLLTFP